MPNKARKSFSSGHGQQFSNGAVTRIWAKNFLTFTEFEMRPEPNLNLIIGPNGTGKSSLVNALVLGLAGKPSILGRAGNLTDFIQYGKDKAELKIELFNEDGRNWEIYREIKGSGGSNWAINNKPTSLKKVEELMSQLKIQVGNLCQCLPQDKVADFAKMNPVDLFQNTQKAAGSEELHTQHQELIRKRAEAQKLEKDLNSGKANLEEQQGHNSRIEEIIRHNEQRERHLAKVKLLKEKEAWMVYTNARDNFMIKYNELGEKKKELKNLEKRTLPQKQALTDAEIKFQTAQQKLRKIEPVPDVTRQTEIMKAEIDKVNDEVNDVKDQLRSSRDHEKSRLDKINSLSLQINAHTEEQRTSIQNNMPEKVKAEMIETDRKIKEVNDEILHLENKGVELTNAKNANIRTLNDYQRELDKLNNVKFQREQHLMRFNHAAYQGLQWMRKNKALFKKPVYEPMMLEVEVLDPRFAKYVEAHIPNKDLVAFSFEDKEDRELFMREVRDKMNLSVNAVDIPGEASDTFHPPDPINTIRRWGFYTYLKEMFHAPEGIMRYLCKQYQVHKIPIGNDDTEKKMDEVVNRLSFVRFYTSTSSVSVKTSKYSKKKVSQSSYLQNARLLALSVDPARIATLDKLVKDHSTVDLLNKQELDKINLTKQEKRNEREELRKEMKRLKDMQRHMSSLEIKITSMKAQRNDLEQNVINIQEEENKSQEKVKTLVFRKAALLKTNAEQLKCLLFRCHQRVLAAAKVAFSTRGVREARKKLEEVQNSLKAFENEIEECRKEKDDLKRRAKEFHNRAMEISDMRPTDKLSNEKKQAFDKLPSELDEINEMIFDEQARANLLGPVEPNVLEEFQNRQRLIEGLEDKMNRQKGELSVLQADIDALKNDWLPAVETLIERINVNFSNFFSRLKCVGEIKIDKSSNEEDYHNWAIKICVKFRDNEPLKELSSQNHSGGEQSVSTALYMLALQELTHVPFRCVDEINQGMDATNERKVFDFITETACQRKNAQYFLLTPKLLPNLDYTRNMKIFVIHNGQFFQCAEKWNLRQFVQLAKNLPD